MESVSYTFSVTFKKRGKAESACCLSSVGRLDERHVERLYKILKRAGCDVFIQETSVKIKNRTHVRK